MAPKRSKKCPGCHLDVALHKSGVAGKDCTGILEDNGAVGQGMQGAMAELQQRKAELTQRLELKKLQREVDALEKELATDTTTTSPLPPAKDGSKTDETQEDERKHVDFGHADITLAQLREDAALQSLVSTKYGDLVGAGKKPEKAAVKQALRKPGSWSDDWVALKEIYFDADPLKIKPAGSAASRQPKKSDPPRFCFRFSRNECAADTCRFDHLCSYCWKKTSQRFKHSAADCHRKQAEEKRASSTDNGANVKSSSA
ncbi:PREDICTED: uncharacterized protein LOC109478867 [Branchiostoma belcheri]|uniref:Uncharacterized protein LOC109478867 n=1 Tax=Branchiostoma belcheri TaxID=7741 RepID=A0A6P5A3C5_BRABE|nr:PREDICTED: uncharacterized protein LOC109478867 [Branchiostoma belcheri]